MKVPPIVAAKKTAGQVFDSSHHATSHDGFPFDLDFSRS